MVLLVADHLFCYTELSQIKEKATKSAASNNDFQRLGPPDEEINRMSDDDGNCAGCTVLASSLDRRLA